MNKQNNKASSLSHDIRVLKAFIHKHSALPQLTGFVRTTGCNNGSSTASRQQFLLDFAVFVPGDDLREICSRAAHSKQLAEAGEAS